MVEVFTYAHYLMRRYQRNKIVSVLTDGSVWYMFLCEVGHSGTGLPLIISEFIQFNIDVFANPEEAFKQISSMLYYALENQLK